jgi:hypothetical protein
MAKKLISTHPCPVASTLDFGTVQPGETVGDIAGVCNWGASQVTAALTHDNSGGLFTGFTLGVYDVDCSPGGGTGPPLIPRPPQCSLVQVAIGDGTQPLPVALGQAVAVSLFFNAPSQVTGKVFTATVEIFSGSAVAATIPVTALVEAPVVSVNWTLANPFGIEIRSLSTTDPLAGIFHTGHVNDVLALRGLLQGALLAGTDAGGVWFLQQPGSSISPTASPLTSDWVNNTVTSLCQGPHSTDHVYVGTGHIWPPYSPGALYETENFFGTSRDISPPGAGNINKILVTHGNPQRLVVAAAGGVFWANIPQPGGSYQGLWNQVQSLPQGSYSGLALGPNDRIVVAAWGTTFGSKIFSGIYYGDWSTGSLVLSRVPDANMPSPPPQSLITFAQGMGRTSIASSPQNTLVMYAVSAVMNTGLAITNAGPIYAVLASPDGGATWKQVATPPLTDPTGRPEPQNQGWYNNCLSVSPFDPNVVAIGWQKHFVSRNGGSSWQVFDYHQGFTALHDDVHTVYFDPTTPDERLYICSDGGVAFTVDRGDSFDSTFNRFLANLECYNISVRDNVLASGLQDNGNVYCILRPLSNPDVSPWVQLPDGAGDGGSVTLISAGQLITSGSNAFQPRTSIPFDINYDHPLAFDLPVAVGSLPATGISVIESVAAPAILGNQRMYAVGSPPNGQTIYGLFGDLTGGQLNWQQVGSVTSDVAGDSISALGPLDDATVVLVGTSNGRFFWFNPSVASPPQGQRISVSPGVSQGQVNRIVFPTVTRAFAVYNGGSTIVRYDGAAWSPTDSGLPGGPYTGIARDGYNRTWVCTDDKVFVSRDDGFTWKEASAGLPRRVHCNGLSYNFAQQNPPLLYLATNGHSVWVTGVLE